jgi:hypothetical protein
MNKGKKKNMKKLIAPILTVLFLGSSAFAMDVNDEIQVVDQNQLQKPITAPVEMSTAPAPTSAAEPVQAKKREEPRCSNCCGLICGQKPTPTPIPVPKPSPTPKPKVIVRYKTIEKKVSQPIIIKRTQDDPAPIIINNNNINNNIINPVPQQQPRRVVRPQYYEDDSGYYEEQPVRYHRMKRKPVEESDNSALYLYGGFTQIKNLGAQYEFRGSHFGLGLFFEHETIEARNDSFGLIKGNQGGVVLHYHFKDRDRAAKRHQIEFGVFAQVGLGKFNWYDTGNNDHYFSAFMGELGADVEIPIVQSFALYAKFGTSYIKMPSDFFHSGENVAAGVRLSF